MSLEGSGPWSLRPRSPMSDTDNLVASTTHQESDFGPAQLLKCATLGFLQFEVEVIRTVTS